MLETLQSQWKNGSTFADPFVTRYINEFEALVMVNGNLSDDADAIIEREIEYFRSINRSFEWKLFSCDLPADLLNRLVDKGFSVGVKEVVCAMDITRNMPTADPSIRVVRVQTESDLKDFRSVAEAVFEKNFAYTTGEIAKCLANGTHGQVGFIAYDDETPISIGRLDYDKGCECAGFYTGGTLPEYRGRGAYLAVVSARARFAKELGASIVWVDARPTSLPILQKLGFEPLVETWPCDFSVK